MSLLWLDHPNRSIALAPIAFITIMNVRAMSDQLTPFAGFRAELVHQNAFRAAITAAYRRPEPECLPMLLDLATLAPEESARAASIARNLARHRHRGSRSRDTSIRFPRSTF
jgi:hypothetical protein